jgi:anti-anti-sigma regulatory factor/anti-sigma regulatory factor (Ser/Thr protein kinase)
MQVEQSTRDGCVVVALTGRIDPFTAPRVRQVLLKQLSRQPLAVICDLAGVEALDPVCASLFSAVANHPSSHWPGTSLLLCGARPVVGEVLGRLRVPHFLQVHASVEEALLEAFSRPPYLRDELRLAPVPTAAAAARAFVRDVCRYWRLALPDPEVIDRAVLVADELVTNAVVHARSEVHLRIELLGDRLYLSAHDWSPRLLRLVPSAGLAEHGRGLLLVERLTRAWGMRRHPDGGKVIWCVLDIEPS